MLYNMKIIFLLLATCFLTPGNGFAQDFSRRIWTYDEYKKMEKGRWEVYDRFEKAVQNKRPPALKNNVKEAVSIAVLYPGKQSSDYWQRSQLSFEARLKEAGLPYRIDSFFTYSSEIRLQEKYINNALKKRPDYMIFTLNALRHMSLIEKIIGRGVTKLILQNITTPLKAWEGSQPFMYVGFDHEAGSKLLADEYIRLTKGKGKFAVFYGPRGYVSQMRGDTFKRYVKDKSALEMVTSYYVGFDRKRAEKAALELISSNQDLKFIYACSTDIALGIADALRVSGLTGKIFVNGWGGGSAELELLSKNELQLTVMRINDDNGAAMADAIIMDVNGESSFIPTVYSGNIILVTEGVSIDDIDRLKKRAFRYSDK